MMVMVNGHVVPWSLVIWSHGHMVTWSHGHMVSDQVLLERGGEAPEGLVDEAARLQVGH